MKQLEFGKEMLNLVAEWTDDYKRNRITSGEPENWPYDREKDDWMQDFFVWLQCKGFYI